MKIGTYAAALGSLQQQRRLDVLANNVANVGTPGFKRDDVRFGSFMNQTTYTQFDQGPMRTTDNPLDIALQGEGLLQVKSDKGTLYTRGGNLTLNKDKILVTQEGWPVLGKSGPIRVEHSDIRIDSEGQVFDGDNSVGTLDLVKFPKETSLKKMKAGYLKPAEDNDKPIPAKNCTILQGALEGANFNVVEEMTRLVDTQRIFEAYQKALQTSSQDLDSQVISKLGTT